MPGAGVFLLLVNSDTIESMIITYYGSEFIKVQTGDTVLAFNPIAKESTFKSSRFGADIALISIDHVDFNGVDNLIYKDKKPFIISSPGEYEIKSIFIEGFMTESIYKGKPYINTIYLVKFDDINICHLGVLNSIDKLTSEIKESIGDVDILLVPTGDGDTLEPDEVSKISVSIAPKIVVPMYHDTSSKKKIDTLMKEIGNGAAPVEKLTVKKGGLSEQVGDVVLLLAQA